MAESELLLKGIESGSLVLVIVLMYLALRYLLTKLDRIDALEDAVITITNTLTERLSELNTSLAILTEQSRRCEQETRESIRRVEIEMRGKN